jgi:hypothetical protein
MFTGRDVWPGLKYPNRNETDLRPNLRQLISLQHTMAAFRLSKSPAFYQILPSRHAPSERGAREQEIVNDKLKGSVIGQSCNR